MSAGRSISIPGHGLQLAELPGDLTLDSDDLRVTQAKGPVHVVTHSEDIDLSEISGDSYRGGPRRHHRIEPAGKYSVDAGTTRATWR